MRIDAVADSHRHNHADLSSGDQAGDMVEMMRRGISGWRGNQSWRGWLTIRTGNAPSPPAPAFPSGSPATSMAGFFR